MTTTLLVKEAVEDEVDVAVLVDVGGVDPVREVHAGAQGDLRGGGERPVAVAEDDGHVVGVRVRGHEVGLAVLVEVTGDDRGRERGEAPVGTAGAAVGRRVQGHLDGGRERAATAAEPQQDEVAAGARDDDVGLAVGVEVAERHRVDEGVVGADVRDGVRRGGAERAAATVQEDREPLGADHRGDVRLAVAVAVEVADRDRAPVRARAREVQRRAEARRPGDRGGRRRRRQAGRRADRQRQRHDRAAPPTATRRNHIPVPRCAHHISNVHPAPPCVT
jgi:hypothetical protein